MRAASPVVVAFFRREGRLPRRRRNAAPVLAMVVLFDPVVDRLRRHLAVGAVGMLLRETPGDLLRRPLVRQPMADRFVDLGIVHLADQWPQASPLLGPPLRPGGEVFVAGPVAPQLATDGRRRTRQSLSDLFLIRSAVEQLYYAIPFFRGKMLRRCWDSVPKGKCCNSPDWKLPAMVFPRSLSKPRGSDLDCV